jgi:methionyl-tRNA formyltransferase
MSAEESVLRIVFAGTPEFAAHPLQALVDSEFDVAAVYCQPDRPKGRGKQLLPPPTKALALQHGIAVYQPLNFKQQEDRDQLAALQPDVMVVVAYGLLLPQVVLDIPRLGCINVHASLLPRWRGAAPIERAIEAGDTETGVTIMQMDAGLDTGPMLTIAKTPIHAEDTGDSLRSRLAAIGTAALLDDLRRIAHEQSHSLPQPAEGVTYAQKLKKEEALIDWQQDAEQIQRRIRAFNSANVMFSDIGDKHGGDMRVKIYAASVTAQQGTAGDILAADKKGIIVACGRDALNITQLQLPGGKVLDAASVLNGYAARFAKGQRFATVDAGIANDR